MKKVISIALACFLSLSITSVVKAQDVEKKEFNTKKTEVNIAIANVFAKNNTFPYYVYDGNTVLPYYAYYDFSNPQTKLIAGLKFHNPQGAVRLALDFNYNSRKYDNEDNSSNTSSYKTLGTGLYLGYQWHSTFNRVNIFYGFDVTTSYTVFSYENMVNNEDYFSKSNEITYGIQPLVGVNFFITPNLSIGTEMKFMVEGYSGKSTNTYNGQEQGKDKTNGFRSQFGPLGFLSLNIHF